MDDDCTRCMFEVEGMVSLVDFVAGRLGDEYVSGCDDDVEVYTDICYLVEVNDFIVEEESYNDGVSNLASSGDVRQGMDGVQEDE